jgi:hypothetical protein
MRFVAVMGTRKEESGCEGAMYFCNVMCLLLVSVCNIISLMAYDIYQCFGRQQSRGMLLSVFS